MMRRRNWDVALLQWATQQEGRPYAWGETDCIALALAAVGVLYPAPPPLPRFPSKVAALRALAEAPDLIVATPAAAGAAPLALGFAAIGDLLVPPPDRDEPAVLVGLGGWALASSPADGVQRVPVAALPPATIAWRLPHG